MKYYYNEEGLLQSLLDLHLENYESLKDLSIKDNTNLKRYFSAIKILDAYDTIYRDVVHSGGCRYVDGYEDWEEILDDGEALWVDTINRNEEDFIREVGKVIDSLEYSLRNKTVFKVRIHNIPSKLEKVLLQHCGRYSSEYCDYQDTLEKWYDLLINHSTKLLKDTIIPTEK